MVEKHYEYIAQEKFESKDLNAAKIYAQKFASTFEKLIKAYSRKSFDWKDWEDLGVCFTKGIFTSEVSCSWISTKDKCLDFYFEHLDPETYEVSMLDVKPYIVLYWRSNVFGD